MAYVPEDAEQRTNHVYGLLMIEKPPIPGALHLAWPFIRRFTERVFAEDRMAVEAEQRAWDEQGEDWNREVFPLILDVRDVLRSNGVPIRSGSALCGAASLCGAAAGGRHPGADPSPQGRGRRVHSAMTVGTSRTRPVTSGASAESREATRSATSAAVPNRRSSIVSARSARVLSGTGAAR